MSLVVESGAGVAGANSYLSLADALAYHADHGNAAWAASTDPLRTAALIRATSYLDGAYYRRWPGMRATQAQGLDWPRSGAWDRDGYPLTLVPAAVAAATAEAALDELATPGALTKKSETGLKSITVGSISKTFASSSQTGATARPAIRQALSRIVTGGATIALSRG